MRVLPAKMSAPRAPLPFAPLPSAGIPFSKYEGLGNDFVVIEEAYLDRPFEAAWARQICDRRRGVGADGVLLLGLGGGRPSMRVFNADGSVPEMCGNGVRCAALHWLRAGRAVLGEELLVHTDAGPHPCHLVEPVHPVARSATRSGSRVREAQVAVRMRHASLTPSEVPVRSEAPMVDAPFELAGPEQGGEPRTLALTAVSMGNPHAVLFDVPEAEQAALGPRIETDPRFPQRVNVGFAALLPKGAGLRLRVWERGVGFTEACGTGACAAAVAAVESGRLERGRALRVELPGGPLTITASALGEPIRMVGPARWVFDGVLAGAGYQA